MAVFFVRLSDGSCVIAEANSETELRELAEFRLDRDASIATVRSLAPGSFSSRWWLDHQGRGGLLPGGLDGSLDYDLVDYIYEYPMILAANKGPDAESCEMPDLPDDTLIIDAKQMRQTCDWEKNWRDHLRKAIEMDIERYRQDR